MPQPDLDRRQGRRETQAGRSGPSCAIVDRCIVDKEVRVGEKALLGSGEDNTPNRDAPDRMNTGLTLVGKRTHVPASAQVGRNVTLRPRTSEAAFGADKVVASGRTL